MIVVYCRECLRGARVLGEQDELFPLVGPASEFWPDRFRCVYCDGPAMGALELEVEASFLQQLRLAELTAQELFGIQMGLGLPNERGCDFETVRDLFLHKRVERVAGTDVRNSTRCVLSCIYFEDGTRLYLGASPQGAVVYRIAKALVERDVAHG